ncbi:hypothetical protein PM183_18530, partial [Escherichia coli]
MKKWTLFFASLMLLVLNVVGTPRSYGRCEQVPDMRSCLSSGAM